MVPLFDGRAPFCWKFILDGRCVFCWPAPFLLGNLFCWKNPVCRSDPFLPARTFKRFAPNLPMVIGFAAAHINLMSERHVRHHDDHRRCGHPSCYEKCGRPSAPSAPNPLQFLLQHNILRMTMPERRALAAQAAFSAFWPWQNSPHPQARVATRQWDDHK
jgi:hypothetical protein